MRRIIMLLAVVACLWTVMPVLAADSLAVDTLTADSAMALVDADLGGADEEIADGSLHKQLKQKFMELPTEKNTEHLAKFQLHIDRKTSLRRRFSSQSVRAYTADIMKVIQNIEE